MQKNGMFNEDHHDVWVEDQTEDVASMEYEVPQT
jgi:hypothetical protein